MPDENHSNSTCSKILKDSGNLSQVDRVRGGRKLSESIQNIRILTVGIISTAVVAGVVGYICGFLQLKTDRNEVETAKTSLESQLVQRSVQLQRANEEILNLKRQLKISSKQLHQVNSEVLSLKSQLQQSSEPLHQANIEIPNLHNHQTIREEKANGQDIELQRPASLRSASKTSSDISKLPKYRIGQNVYVGDVRWKVLEVKDRGMTLRSAGSSDSRSADRINTTGTFIQLYLEVVNLGPNTKTATRLDLIDSKGIEYAPAIGVDDCIPDTQRLSIIGKLNPNVPVTFSEIYNVQEDADGFMVRVTDLSLLGQWGQREALIRLD